MNVLIHASLDFKENMIFVKKYVEAKANTRVMLPELTRYQDIRDVNGDDTTFTKIKNRLTKENFRNVEICDALLILNYTHRGIENYIGGNSFMEMVIAFYLNKPIFILNPIPEKMPYTEEIKSLYPIVVNNLDYFINSLNELVNA